MCLIIVKPMSKKVPYEHFENAYSSNKHGIGYMFKENKENIIKKFVNFEDFIKSYEKDINKNLIIHFRYGTSGLLSEDNIHPFLFQGDKALVHNGIFSDFVKPNSPFSDTYHFTRHIEKTYPKDFLKKKEYLAEIDNYITSTNSKIVILADFIYIFNKSKWITDNNIAYSNNGYLDSWKKYYYYEDYNFCSECFKKINLDKTKTYDYYQDDILCKKCYDFYEQNKYMSWCIDCYQDIDLNNKKSYNYLFSDLLCTKCFNKAI